MDYDIPSYYYLLLFFFRLSSELEGYDDVSNYQFSFVHGQTFSVKTRRRGD
jgi:hypothetical protein